MHGMRMIAVTREMQFAREAASRVVFLDNGRIVEERTAVEFFERPKTERPRRFLERFNRSPHDRERMQTRWT